MRSPITSVTSISFALSLLLTPSVTRATNMVCNVFQNTVNPTVNWDLAIWGTNLTQTVGLFSMAAGNNYTLLSNTVAFGNGVNNARLRNNVTNTGNTLTLIGDSLTLTTNTEVRFKNI